MPTWHPLIVLFWNADPAIFYLVICAVQRVQVDLVPTYVTVTLKELLGEASWKKDSAWAKRDTRCTHYLFLIDSLTWMRLEDGVTYPSSISFNGKYCIFEFALMVVYITIPWVSHSFIKGTFRYHRNITDVELFPFEHVM